MSTRLQPRIGMQATIRQFGGVAERATIAEVQDGGRRLTVLNLETDTVSVFTLRRPTARFVLSGAYGWPYLKLEEGS